MTPERKKEIMEAAANAERYRMVLQASMEMNVPQDYEARMQAAQAHALRVAELNEAETILQKLLVKS